LSRKATTEPLQAVFKTGKHGCEIKRVGTRKRTFKAYEFVPLGS